jgi:hypothetical protein
MAQLLCTVAEAPVGWMLFLDGVRVGGIYGTKEAGKVRDGEGVQIRAPSMPSCATSNQATRGQTNGMLISHRAFV